MPKHQRSETKPAPLENLDAALSDVPSNAHETEPGQLRPDHALVAGTSGAKPTKKPRTESPERIALRAFQRRRELHDRLGAIHERHMRDVAKVTAEITAHDADCEKLPEAVQKILVKLRGDL